MKRTIIILLITIGLPLLSLMGNKSIMSPTAVFAQVMNKDLGNVIVDKVPAKQIVTCPYCNEKFLSLKVAKEHSNQCPYRFCIEFSYDEAGNRIKRSVVWTVAPTVKKKQEEIKKSEEEQ